MAHRAKHDIIVIGASAGGLEALAKLCGGLKKLPAALFAVLHTSPRSPGVLPKILGRNSVMPVEHARDGEKIKPGRIYVAPPDFHLLLKPGKMEVTRGPRENGFRPAVDPLFRTAARAYGARVIGIVLSGSLDDGTEGMAAIKAYGGVAIAQEPAEAAYPSMPGSVIEHVGADYVLRLDDMPAALEEITARRVTKTAASKSRPHRDPPEPAEGEIDTMANNILPGPPSPLTCPECGGSLWELEHRKLVRYRCHVGHNYTQAGLEVAQQDSLETVLWSALRALEERAELRRRMARRAAGGRYRTIVHEYEAQAESSQKQADVIRDLLLKAKPLEYTVSPQTGDGNSNGKRQHRLKSAQK